MIRRYTNLAAPQLLVTGVNDSAQTLTVASTSLFPDAPFLLGIDRGTAKEEVVLCTEKTSTTFTVTRGYDGTSAVSHDLGALVEHTVAAIDYREAVVASIDTAVRNTLAGGELWEGRVIYNTDLKKQQVYTGSGWSNVGPATSSIDFIAGSSAPAGTLLANGQAVSRSTYADLFAAVGTTYGVGDGSTTFNVPDVRGRMPLGLAAAGTGSVLGEKGGQIDHIHTGPVHTHSVPNTEPAGVHSHSFSEPTSSAGSHSHSFSQPTGNAGAHTHRLVYQSVGSTGTLHSSVLPVDKDGNSSVSSRRHADEWPDRPDTNSSGNHNHSLPSTSSTGSHTHNLPSTSTSGNHFHTINDTGESGGGNTGAANPPFIALTAVIYT